EKVHVLRSSSKGDLTSRLNELRLELSQLRVAQVTGGAASKLAKIKVVRKNIARVLTVYNQSMKAKYREAFKDRKYVPLDLRAKKTRAIRRRMTPEQLALKTLRVEKRLSNLPKRRYALKA
ncbi:unnamed protein product, partial [Discosporangium mesarthrocarpum]